MTTRRKSANIYDYPEHLNPFHEEDNHNRLRFWTVTKKKTRSNSFSFQSVKDFRGSIRLPRFQIRNTNSSSLSELNCYRTKAKPETHQPENSQNTFFSTLRRFSRSFSIRNRNRNSNSSSDQTSQIDDDEVQLRHPTTSRQITESHSTNSRLSVTPLPRSRFHERVKNSENTESLKSLEKSTLSISPSPLHDKNPFNDESDEPESQERLSVSPISSPLKSTTPRKKKRAPPPPVRKSSLKHRTLEDYNSSKIQNEDTLPLTSGDNVPKELNASDNHKQEIEIKVELITDENERKEETKSENDDLDNLSKEEIKVENENVSKDEAESQDKMENSEETKLETEIKNNESVTEDNSISEQISSVESVSMADISTEDNTEINLPSCEVSASNENSENPQELIEDASDLLELVTKLKEEVDKLTDDTNNNVIESEEERKTRNIRSWVSLHKSNQTKINLESDSNDDNDVICREELSPRLIRLRKDNDWIRQTH